MYNALHTPSCTYLYSRTCHESARTIMRVGPSDTPRSHFVSLHRISNYSISVRVLEGTKGRLGVRRMPPIVRNRSGGPKWWPSPASLASAAPFLRIQQNQLGGELLKALTPQNCRWNLSAGPSSAHSSDDLLCSLSGLKDIWYMAKRGDSSSSKYHHKVPPLY